MSKRLKNNIFFRKLLSPVFLLLTFPVAVFLHLFFSSKYFIPRIPFWNINLLFSFEAAAIFLGAVWFIYSKKISNYLYINFEESLEKDLHTYFPLFLLLFYYLELEVYKLSTEILWGVILFLIILLKSAVILDIKKNNKNYVYLLRTSTIILPLLIIHYFGFTYLNKIRTQNIKNIVHTKPLKPKPSRPTLVDKFKTLYDSDPMSLLGNDIPNIYKKKIQIANEIRNALVLLPPERIEMAVHVPPDSYLQFGFGVWIGSLEGRGDGIQFKLFLNDKNGTKNILSKYIDPKHYKKDRKWFDLSLDLRSYANQKISFIFEALGSNTIKAPFERTADNRDDYAAISDPEIVSYNPPADNNPAAKNKNIILISLDTLRADHLGCYGYKRKNISPNIDVLAGNGILFEKAISHAPWTLASHMSIFTSLLPSYHRVTEDRRLSKDITTLTEVLRSEGYRTAAFTGGAFMNGHLGFCRGFDTYEQPELLWVKDDAFKDDKHFDKIIKWLEKNGRQNFFLFLHTYRIHAPYTGYTYAGEVMKKAEIEKARNLKKLDITNFESFLKENNLYNKKVTENLYDGEIKEADKYIGVLINNLKRMKLLHKTIIILTSDHGEEFCDHYDDAFYDKHCHSLYDELLHVPLIFFIPEFANGLRIKQQVALIDIMPTVLELTKIKYDSNEIQGNSLLTTINGKKTDKESIVISEQTGGYARTGRKKSLRMNNLKYIYAVDEEGKILSEELYDLSDDDGEKHNIKDREPRLSNLLKNKINEISGKTSLQQTENQKFEFNSKTRKRLKSLGYL